MVNCIICNKNNLEIDSSEEHIFPYCIGGNKKTYLVCKKCNSKLGDKIDSEYTEQTLIKYLRNKHNLKNRDGIVPSITTKDFGWKDKNGEPAIIKSNGLYEPPKTNIEEIDGKLIIKTLASDKQSMIKSIEREVKRKGLNFLVKEDEEALSKVKLKIEKCTLETKFCDDEVKMKNICLKIAYEMACEQYGEEYMNDSIGSLIRKDLYNLIYNNLPIDYSKYSVECVFVDDLEQSYDFHECDFIIKNNLCMAGVKLFNIFFCFILMSKSVNEFTDK